MNSPHVYDKAKYHYETIEQHGLSEEHAANHTVFFLRWLIENNLMSEEFMEESGDVVEKFRAGKATIHQVYEWWDCCLIDDMLSEEGNSFAMRYFDFEKGKYIHDYIEHLQGTLPSEFHIDYNEANYQRMKEASTVAIRNGRRPRKVGGRFDVLSVGPPANQPLHLTGAALRFLATQRFTRGPGR